MNGGAWHLSWLLLFLSGCANPNPRYSGKDFEPYRNPDIDINGPVPPQLIRKLGDPDQRIKFTGTDSCYIYDKWTEHARFCFSEDGKLISSGWGIGKFSEEPVRDEYFDLDTADNPFVGSFLKGFRAVPPASSDSLIRILVIPSFTKELFLEFGKGKEGWVITSKIPDSSVWEDMQDITRGDDGRVVAGRVKSELEYHPSVGIASEDISLNPTAMELLGRLRTSNIGSMRSIRHANLRSFDGTMIYAWLTHGKTSHAISWRVSNYDHERYNRLQESILDLYHDQVKTKANGG